MVSTPKKESKKLNKLLFISIFIIALFLRLYKLDTPLADWHSWRQSDTASVSREFLKNGVDLFQPKYQDLSNIPSGLENPQGYRMVEFPIINAITVWKYKLFTPAIELHVFSRLVSIAFSLGSLLLLYSITALYSSKKEALITAFIFAVLPYNVFYSRTVLPEIPLVFFSLLALFSLLKYFHTLKHSLKNPWYWISIIASAIALLIKPTALFFALPAIYIGWKQCGATLIKDKKSYLFLILAFAPIVVWRLWIQHFPEGIPAFEWLLNGNGIRFKGSWFRWLFAQRIGQLILGYWGLVPLALGFISKAKNYFIAWWAFAMLVYLTVFATGNVQHDYYQIILIPIISIYVAKGFAFLLSQKSLAAYSLVFVSFAFMMAFSWFEVRGYYNINNPAIVKAGKFVDQNTPSDSLIVAPYQGDTAFLYQTNRRGWPIGGSIDQRIKQGANYYVTTTMDDEAKGLSEKCEVIESNDQFALIKLECQDDFILSI